MQQLAINPKVFEDNFINYKENITSIVLLVEKVEKFHQIIQDSKGKWSSQLEKISNKLEPNEKSMFDLLITKKLTNYYSYVNIDEPDFLKGIAKKTHDSLIVSDDKIENVKYCYSQKVFISDDYKPNNILYRIPKSLKIPPKYKFANFDFISPYIRRATKIELIDKQLFKDTREKTEKNLLMQMIKKATNLKEIQLHWEPNEINLMYLAFIKELKVNFPKLKILENKQYKSRSKNHDRFIIINNNELSIRFSTSFNNFYIENNCFISKAGFLINFEKGRSFYE